MDRYFISLDLAIPVIESVMQWQRSLHASLPQGKDAPRIDWVPAQEMHVTLKYIGEMESTLTERISEQLIGLSRPLFPFQLTLTHITMDDEESPKIIWACFDTKGGEVVGLLQRAIEQNLEQIGVAKDHRKFYPRMMLGRVWAPGGAADRQKIAQALQSHLDKPHGQSTVRDLLLTVSRWRKEEPQRKVVDRYELGAN